MLRSMTGYGRGEAGDAEAQFTVEVRSLNNRYLDVQIKAPRSLFALEGRIRKVIQDRFSRGRFDVLISRAGERESSAKLTLNAALAKQYIAILRAVKESEHLGGDVDVATVSAFPDLVGRVDTAEDPEGNWAILERGIDTALRELDRMRSDEGAALAKDIRGRLGIVERLVSAIKDAAPATVEAARKRMEENLQRLLAEQTDPARLAQEIAILAERTDVTEELTRLGIHVSKFYVLMESGAREGIGRKLDFLLQEMGREANTVASKSMNADIAHDVVNIKAELEKIREQAQNIE